MESRTKAGDKWPSHTVIRGRYQRTVIPVSSLCAPQDSPLDLLCVCTGVCVCVCYWVKLTLSWSSGQRTAAGCIPCVCLWSFYSLLHGASGKFQKDPIITFWCDLRRCNAKPQTCVKYPILLTTCPKNCQHGTKPTLAVQPSACTGVFTQQQLWVVSACRWLIPPLLDAGE